MAAFPFANFQQRQVIGRRAKKGGNSLFFNELQLFFRRTFIIPKMCFHACIQSDEREIGQVRGQRLLCPFRIKSAICRMLAVIAPRLCTTPLGILVVPEV